MEVYKLATNSLSRTGGFVILTIKLLNTRLASTDMHSFTHDPIAYQGVLLNDFYFPYKINMGQVISIKSLDEKKEFDTAIVKTGMHGNLEFTKGKLFQLKNYDFSRDDTVDNFGLQVFKYKAAVVNAAPYVGPQFTGVKLIHMINGKIAAKVYFKHGKEVTREDFYNNPFNSRQRLIRYSDIGTIVDEYVYDHRENLITQNIYNSDGSFFKCINYKDSYSNELEKPNKGRKRKRALI